MPRRLVRRARSLRRRTTPAEHRLWQRLRNRQLDGLKFRRQHVVGTAIVDLYCSDARLAIELDGGGHNLPEKARQDARRSEQLAAEGVAVIRFWNNEVLGRFDDVVEEIWRRARARIEELRSCEPR